MMILPIARHEVDCHLEVLIDWEGIGLLRKAILRIIVLRMFDVRIALDRMQVCVFSCLHGLRQEVLHQYATVNQR